VSGKACRLAPVAIGKLILSELYVARRVRPIEHSRLRAREPTTDRTALSGCPWLRPFAEVISIFLYPDG